MCPVADERVELRASRVGSWVYFTLVYKRSWWRSIGQFHDQSFGLCMTPSRDLDLCILSWARSCLVIHQVHSGSDSKSLRFPWYPKLYSSDFIGHSWGLRCGSIDGRHFLAGGARFDDICKNWKILIKERSKLFLIRHWKQEHCWYHEIHKCNDVNSTVQAWLMDSFIVYQGAIVQVA